MPVCQEPLRGEGPSNSTDYELGQPIVAGSTIIRVRTEKGRLRVFASSFTGDKLWLDPRPKDRPRAIYVLGEHANEILDSDRSIEHPER